MYTVTEADTDMEMEMYEDEKDFSILTKYQLPIYIFPFIFGTTSNVIILIIIICNKDMRTISNMYILNLAISDIIYLMVLFSEACANEISDTWTHGDFMCKFLPFCRRLSVGLSAYSVAVLSIQRYRVTVNPFQFRVSSKPTWRVTLTTIYGVWILAASFAVPAAMSSYLCGRFILKDVKYYQRVVSFELLVSCALPLCVIAFTYIMTARHLMESSRPISEGTQNTQLKTRRNSAKILVGLTVVFLISYLPSHAYWTYIIWNAKFVRVYHHGWDGSINISSEVNDISLLSDELLYTYLISTCFLSINPCLNPVALFCTSSPFRQQLKRYLTCFCKINSPPTDIELAGRN
jgi:hypothetical protein